MRARVHIPLTQNPVFFFSMRARSLSTQFSHSQVSLRDQKQPFPQLQPVNLCCPIMAPACLSKDFSAIVLQPHWPCFYLSKSHLFWPQVLPQVLCTCSCFWTPNPLSPHLGKSDIFLTDKVSTWKSSTVRKGKSSQDWESTTQTVIDPNEASSKISRNQYFSQGHVVLAKQLIPCTSKWLCLLTNCLPSPTLFFATFWIKMAHSPTY